MWISITAAIAAPDPGWVDTTAAAFAASPREGRISALQSRVAEETDQERKSALIALGRLFQAWPADSSPEVLAVYAREVLATEAGRRSYVIAAAGFGAALGSDGQPTMTTDQAKSLYADRRYTLGVVAWSACAPPSGALGGLEAPSRDGYWLAADVEQYRDVRRPSGVVTAGKGADAVSCRQGEVEAGAGLGWTLFEGERPVDDLDRLGPPPAQCEPVRLRILYATSKIGGGEVVDVSMPARVEDCGTMADWEEVAREGNTRLLADLRLQPDDVRDLEGSPSTLDGFRACGSKRPTEAVVALCAIR